MNGRTTPINMFFALFLAVQSATVTSSTVELTNKCVVTFWAKDEGNCEVSEADTEGLSFGSHIAHHLMFQ